MYTSEAAALKAVGLEE
jgi:uncharacterized protein